MKVNVCRQHYQSMHLSKDFCVEANLDLHFLFVILQATLTFVTFQNIHFFIQQHLILCFLMLNSYFIPLIFEFIKQI